MKLGEKKQRDEAQNLYRIQFDVPESPKEQDQLQSWHTERARP